MQIYEFNICAETEVRQFMVLCSHAPLNRSTCSAIFPYSMALSPYTLFLKPLAREMHNLPQMQIGSAWIHSFVGPYNTMAHK